MCLEPRLIENKRYKITNKSKERGFVPPLVDDRTKYVAIGCQYCIECRKKRAREWQVRLLEEIKDKKNGRFVSMTFTPEWLKHCTEGALQEEPKAEGYQLDNLTAKWAVRRFLERWRKDKGESVRHWLITELGQKGTEHMHIHGIIWTDETMEYIEKKWRYGTIWKKKEKEAGYINYVNERTINYIIKYITKIDEKHKGYIGKVMASNKPHGIGGKYVETANGRDHKYNGDKTRDYYRLGNGQKVSNPIYYRNKLYTEEERQELWIKLLDKEERYVLGEKVSIKEGEEKYYRMLAEAQKVNKELGYGGVSTGWEKATYERERRRLKQAEKIAKARRKKD